MGYMKPETEITNGKLTQRDFWGVIITIVLIIIAFRFKGL